MAGAREGRGAAAWPPDGLTTRSAQQAARCVTQDVELAGGLPGAAKGAARRRGCCGGVCGFVLAHWSKAVVLAIVITVIVLFSVRVSPPGAQGLGFRQRLHHR